MQLDPAEMDYHDIYKLLIASIAPRPIAWVSTVNREGVPNLAPFSFFNGVCPNPPTVLICTGVRDEGHYQKDTYDNIRETGEFTINFVTEPLVGALNISAKDLPPGINEFALAGLTPVPGVRVRPPSVKESPIHFECKLNQIVTINENPGGGHIIIGTVVHMAFDDALYQPGYHLDLNAYQPLGRAGGSVYVRSRDRFEMARLPVTPEDVETAPVRGTR